MDSSMKRAKEGSLTCEEQLIPNIPNDVTVNLISEKLTWRTLSILSSVSRAWNQEFQRRQNDRLCTLATEKLVYIPCTKRRRFTVHSLAKDEFSYRLPALPNFPIPIAEIAEWRATLENGRIYAVGAGRDDLYVMDLAIGRKWEQRKKMEYHARNGFRLRTLRGKIYVVSVGHGSEAEQGYDPESDTWDVIQQRVQQPAMAPGLTYTLCVLVDWDVEMKYRKSRGKHIPPWFL